MGNEHRHFGGNRPPAGLRLAARRGNTHDNVTEEATRFFAELTLALCKGKDVRGLVFVPIRSVQFVDSIVVRQDERKLRARVIDRHKHRPSPAEDIALWQFCIGAAFDHQSHRHFSYCGPYASPHAE